MAFANFSTSMASSLDDKAKPGKDNVLDYSKQELSLSSDARDKVTHLHGEINTPHHILLVATCICCQIVVKLLWCPSPQPA